MKKIGLGCKITREIEHMAKEVCNINCPSFDYNRALFQKRLIEYYEKGTFSSDKLIIRKNEIDYYGNRLTDVLLSALVGSLLGSVISLVNEFELSNTGSVYGKMVGIGIFLFLGVISVIVLSVPICCAIRALGSVTNYQKLHCEEFEKELIEKQLSDRLNLVNEEHMMQTNMPSTEVVVCVSE